eukprot:m.231246 g.231246  ORF g.231246 m.231246 type:complete len:417 (+) comp17364_c0_seq1:26-1276(+)
MAFAPLWSLLLASLVALSPGQDATTTMLLKSASSVYIYDLASMFPRECMLDSPHISLNASNTEGLNSNRLVHAGGYFITVNKLKHQLRAPHITLASPETAELFVIDFDVDASFDVGDCQGTSHSDRLEKYINALLASPIYQQYSHRQHFWIMLSWMLRPGMESKQTRYFPVALRKRVKLTTMTLGRYLTARISKHRRVKESLDQVWRGETLDTGHYLYCVVALPVVAPSSLYVPDLSVDGWQDRSISIFFRDRGKKACLRESAARLRRAALTNLSSDDGSRVISKYHASSPAAYQAEIKSAKYCLVIRCDDPQTSRFIDSLAAGCIPVIINDLFLSMTAPFHTHINYAAFAIFIPEAKWLASPEAALKIFAQYETRAEQARRVAALAHYRDALLWNSPKSTTGLMAVHEALHTCGE